MCRLYPDLCRGFTRVIIHARLFSWNQGWGENGLIKLYVFIFHPVLPSLQCLCGQRSPIASTDP